MISIFAIQNVPIITSVDQFWDTIRDFLGELQEDDILVFAHTPYSRISNLSYTLEEIIPSEEAIKLANELEKDPRHIEVILRESDEIVKYGNRVLITQNKAGIVCANAGIDQSNAGLGKVVAVPHDPDMVASQVRDFIKKESGKTIAVIMSDTVGRALRKGAVNIGIGCAGIFPLRSEIGHSDLFGYTMRVSEVAQIDEIASAAELLQGQTDEGCPFVVVRGVKYERMEGVQDRSSAKFLNRPREQRLFQ